MNLPKLLLVVLVLTAVCCATAGLRVVLERPPPSGPAAPPPRIATRAAATAAGLLQRWDGERAAAWADARPSELAALYTPGSAAARTDLAMLRAWRHRGLEVAGLHTQLLAVAVVARTRDRWVLRVTDRLASGTAVRGRARAPLPRDRPSSYVVTLRRIGRAWRVDSVRRTSPG